MIIPLRETTTVWPDDLARWYACFVAIEALSGIWSSSSRVASSEYILSKRRHHSSHPVGVTGYSHSSLNSIDSE